MGFFALPNPAGIYLISEVHPQIKHQRCNKDIKMQPLDFDSPKTNSLSLSEQRQSNDLHSESDHTDENLISCTSASASITSDQRSFGWWRFQPKCMQGLLSAKWALFWMCWAGALQGTKYTSISILTKLLVYNSQHQLRSRFWIVFVNFDQRQFSVCSNSVCFKD